MKKWNFLIIVFAFAVTDAIAQKHPRVNAQPAKDTVRIANDSLEYEIIIIDPGFNAWLNGRAKPRNFYGLTFLETRNNIWVSEWNRRVLDPQRYNPNFYEMRIDYDPTVHYGYEVNYLLYNYFLYFQQTNRQKL